MSELKNLEGTVSLVTGASSGIGHATALRLAAQGSRVAIVARRADNLEQLAQSIRSAGGQSLSIVADLSDAGEAARAVTATVAEFGRLDTLVNSAGVMLNGPSLEARLDQWDQMIDINLRGLMYVTKAALPHLVDAVASSPRKVADVVNISSIAGRVASANVAVYNATKFAVTAATEAWRQEFARRSLRFSVVEPGATTTELWNQEGQRESFAAKFGQLEMLHAEDIAEAVSFIVTSPRRVAVNEIVVRPTDQV